MRSYCIEYSTYNWDQYYAMQYDLNDQDGWAVSYISIVASVEEVATYRSELATLTEYAQESGKDALDELVIDGITFQGIVYGDYWIYGEYTARVPEASITLTLTISEPEDIADVLPDILASIRFTFPIPDPPYTDPPLPEDGIAYVPAPTAVTVGGYELSAAWLPTSAPIIAKDTYNTGIACIDDLVYILDDTTLYSCKIENSALVSAAEPMKLDQSYCFMCSDVYGSLYLTDGFYSGLTLLEGDTNTFTMDGYLAMHPDGGWGLTFWSSYDVSKATFTSDGIAVKPWFLTNLSDDARQGRFSSIGTIAVTQDAVFVAGTDATTDYATRIAMYDFDGNELAVYGSTDWLNDSAIGSVSAMIQTPNGILVQDAFYGSLILFALDGTYLGSVACDDLLGTQYCRPLAMAATPDGALLLVAQEREDQSATELLVFEVTGF
ncbi:MAG TPA: hypothetical protein PK537_10100 [Candidatus Limiplasma sp.]|nr:hypothetical protein [Candidatus Limiplasma sp.]